jgi:nucleotide-binding universal stress UspA family protein
MSTEKTLPKIEYKRILYTTDLSESGRHAFPYAASIARRFDSELTVFHVVETRDFERYLVGYISEDLWKDLQTEDLDEARRILISRKRDDVEIRDSVQQFCEESLSRQPDKSVFSYHVKVEMGEPVEKILQEAHSGDYDLVVISKRGRRSSVKDAVMGGTARRVIRRCNVPVMVVQLPD